MRLAARSLTLDLKRSSASKPTIDPTAVRLAPIREIEMSKHQKIDTDGATPADQLIEAVANDGAGYNFTFLEPQSNSCIGKEYTFKDDEWHKSADISTETFWRPRFVRAETLEEMGKAFLRLEKKHGCAIMAHRTDNPDIIVRDTGVADGRKGFTRKLAIARCLLDGTILKPTFVSVPLYFVFLDLDNFACSGTPAQKAAQARAAMPVEFQQAGCVWKASASHALHPHLSKLHLVFLFTKPLFPHVARAWAAETGLKFDATMGTTAQPFFTERPRHVGAPDPIAVRVGMLDGVERVIVPAHILAKNIAKKEGAAAKPANPNMPANTSRGFDHFVDATVRRAAPTLGHRKTTVDLIAKDVRQSALEFEVGEALAHAYLAPSDETQAEAVAAMKEHGYAKATEAALQLREAGDAIADAWEDREPLDDWEAYAITAYNAAPWGNFMGETRKQDDGEGFGVPDLSEDSDLVGDRPTVAYAPEKPGLTLKEAAYRLAQSHKLGDLLIMDADRVAKAARAKGHAELAAAADALSDAALMGDDTAGPWATYAAERTRLREIEAEKAASPTLAPWKIETDAEITPRRFVHGKDYIRRFLSVTIAPGGRGKSGLLLAEAVAMACGSDVYGRPYKLLRVLYYNGEDPQEEIDRRVRAILKYRGLSAAALGDRLFTCSGRDKPLKLAEVRDGRPMIRDDAKRLEALIRSHGIDVAIFDPFVWLL